MHIELIEPRRMFAASGLDTQFGDGDGRVELPSHYAVLSMKGYFGNVYAVVANNSTKQQYLYKYDGAGHVDTGFGDGGRQVLAFRTPVGLTSGFPEIAVNPNSGEIYVGYTSSHKSDTVARATLQIEAFNSSGYTDLTFADHGVYSYSAQARLNPNADVAFTLDKLVPLAHGDLLIAMDSTQSTDNADSTHFKLQGTTELTLQRLRSGGRRNPAFGKGGVRVIATGTFSRQYDDSGSGTSGVVPAFGDFKLVNDDEYRVIFSSETFDRRESGIDTVRRSVSSVRSVTSMLVKSDGTIDARSPKAFTRSISRVTANKTTSDVREFVPVQVAAEGDEGISVIGLYTDAPVSANPGPVGALQIHVTAARRTSPEALPLPAKARFVSVARSDGGTTYVTTTAGTTAFSELLHVDRDWGVNGTTPGVYTAYFPDDFDGLLFVYPDGFGRLDGK